jgi:hypothetical protein
VTEWDERQLCSDGACVGVIGADGACKTCQRSVPFWGDERRRGLLVDDSDAGPDDGDDRVVDDEREVCVDGSCIGVIGTDGQCNVCGHRPGVRVVPPQVRLVLDPEAVEDDRRLCPDGSCVGLLGPDGVCRVCARSGVEN